MRKYCGFTPNLDCNPVFTKFNLTEFLHTSYTREYAAHQGKRELVSMVSVYNKQSVLSDGEGMYFCRLCGAAFIGKFLSPK